MTDVTYVSSFEGGQRYAAGAVTVLSLHGSHYQMGRQYGMLMKYDINSLYHSAIDGRFIGKENFTYDRLKQIAYLVYSVYPQKFKDIIIGMSETSGLGLEKQIILNAIEMFPKYNQVLPALCSGIAVWGDYTGGGPLVFGRNNDDTDYYREFGAYTIVAVFHPTDSGQPTAIVNYAGLIYAPSGMNRDGVFLELNSGNVEWIYPDRPLIFSTLFSFLEDYSTLSELYPAFLSIKGDATLSSIVNVADDREAFSYEISAFVEKNDDVKRRYQDRQGLLVATNHFVDPSWGIAPPTPDNDYSWTVKRRDNLLTLAERYKGSFDVERMKQVLDTKIDDGGATQPNETIYQIIAVPKERLMWLQAPGNFAWQKIDLNRFF
ncbi:hypothetical protein KKG24_04790 [Patescibacteria group bacterium]|nr:hypothetical protein [Patescibacteria group bacterium]MBU1745897.1 hypothetical protein [Pseudomonadota bacterium]MBU1964238.1 hypothetical protein [Pseudomonadota bacterium]